MSKQMLPVISKGVYVSKRKFVLFYLPFLRPLKNINSVSCTVQLIEKKIQATNNHSEAILDVLL